MLIAEVNGNRISPIPKVKACCPLCKTPVIPKCGSVNLWHFAHKSVLECDPWRESETDWHRKWKLMFKEEFREVVIGPHRADVKLASGLVIEFRNSPISPDTLQERERFYGVDSMIWIFNAEELWEAGRFPGQEEISKRFLVAPLEQGGEFPMSSFEWKHPWKSLWFSRAQVYLDFGSVLFKLVEYTRNIPCTGVGLWRNRVCFAQGLCPVE